MTRRPPASAPDVSDYDALVKRNRELEEKLALLDDGTQIDRDKYEDTLKRLKSEREDNMQIIGAYRNMEKSLEESQKKCEKYQQIIKKYKEQYKNGDKSERNREQQILDLKKDKSEMESLNVKHRQDILSYIAENQRLIDTNKRLEAHIQDVDSALVQMLERNKELARSLQESELRNENLVIELDQEKKNIYRLEHDLAKLRDDEKRDQRFLQESRLDVVETNFANAQQKLLMANNTISELKSRIEKLEIEEQRAVKLQIELAKQKQINQNLENQNDLLEMELESNRGSDEEYRKQIEDLRDRIQQLDEHYEDRVNAMKVEVDYYRKRTEKEFKINTELEEQMTNKDKEIEDLKEEIASKLDKTYGLPQAVNEIRQLKAMVSVRDAQIGDMIVENQWTQKVISGLEELLPPTVNLNKFFNDLQKREIDFQNRKAQRNIMALLKKSLAENKGNIVGEIKIILGSRSGKKNTMVLKGNEGDNLRDSGFVQQIASGLRNRSRRGSSALNSSEIRDETDRGDLDTDSFVNDSESENDIASSALNIMMKSKQRKDQQRKMKEEIYEQTLQSIPHITSSKKMVTSDVSCQVFPDDFLQGSNENKNSDEQDEEKIENSTSNVNEDRWVRELRNKLKKYKNEKVELNDQLRIAREDFNKKSQESEEKSLEIKTLTVRIEDLLAQIDNLKKELNKSKKKSFHRNPELEVSDSESEDENDYDSDVYSARRRRRQRFRSAKNDDPLQIELKNVKVQVISPGVNVEISKRSVHFEVRPVMPKLSFEHDEDSVFQLPTPEELEVTDARIKVLQKDLFEAERKAADSVQEIENLKHKIVQKDEMMSELQKTISNLEKRLDEQRLAIQEKISELDKDANRILEARLKEARDMDAVNNSLRNRNLTESNLSDVSMRLEQLNRDKAKLIDELSETKEAMKFSQRTNDQLRERLKKLQMEYDELLQKQEDAPHQKLMDYSSGLKMKYTALQKKYTDLQREYEKLEKFKDYKNEPLTSGSAKLSARSDEGEQSASAREASKLKSAMVKIEQMKTQNEEMQLKLGKAQTTIERLNQLLQRKEKQLTKVQEQASQYKHMLARQQTAKKT